MYLQRFRPLFSKVALAALGVAMFTASAIAQAPPPNDNFATATVLNSPIITVTGSNLGATKQFGQGEPFPVNSIGGASVWWRWTATASGQTTIDTMGSSFDTLMGVYTGTALNQLTLVADNDNFSPNIWSRVQFNATAGTTYHILIDGQGPFVFPPQPARGSIVLRVQGVGGLEIETPTNGMVFTLNEPIPVAVTILSNFPNAPATRVDFYANNTLFATSATEPFTAVATNLPAGSNSLHVVAFDNMGAPVQSAVLNILVQNIGVTLLTPFEGTMYFNTNPITVTAWGYLPSGTLDKVEFYVDNVKFGEDDTTPYSATWSNVVAGSHRFTALGRTATTTYRSQAVNVGVAAPLIPARAIWNYLDNGIDQGTDWIAPTFDDGGWTNGPAELGYGDGDEATVIGFGPDPNNKFPTAYFRHSFSFANTGGLTNLALTVERDDGAVVYLNGREIFRSDNLPAAPAPITYSTLASGQGNEDTIDFLNLSVTNLVEGVNVIAVEVHQQSPNSSDISFALQLLGIPEIIRNQYPLVAVTNPPDGTYYLAPSSIVLTATASDADGSVAKVEFFSDEEKIGEATTSPYSITWNNPPVRAHTITAVATDDQGGVTVSEPILVIVYDAVATPVARVTVPRDGAIMEGPTNLHLTATAYAVDGVTNVEFYANGVAIGQDATAPYNVIWTSIFGTNALTAVAVDSHGIRGTSPVTHVVITIPPTNTVAPIIVDQTPRAFADITNLTRIAIVFSEIVQNVDASDLLLNGVPATGLTGRGSNYVFTFPQPPYGDIQISWAAGHGITDYGYPSPLPFNGLGGDAIWQYQLQDLFPPIIIARTPGPGTTVTNLTQVNVRFSEPVTGVDVDDLLVNGVPAYALSGSGSNYLFSVSQPPSGPVNITWLTNHGITDLAIIPNAFNSVVTGAFWNLTLDSRVTLAASNGVWRLLKGRAEASTPTNAWRFLGFNDSGWTNAPAPFYMLDPYGSTNYPGTSVADMAGQYTSIYLRREFEVHSRGSIATLLLNAQSDDGFIAWINGTEVLRYNVRAGELPYNGTANSGAPEPAGAGAAYITHILTNANRLLVNGTNIIAVHAFNISIAQTDFGFNADLFGFTTDADFVAPTIVLANPAPGDIFDLTNLVVTFNESVTNVDAGDLLVNGVAATNLVIIDDTTYNFSFPQPPYGPVVVTWAAGHGILDLDEEPKPFNALLNSSILHYALINPSNPRIVSQSPLANATITNLTSVSVTFTEPVAGVQASDFLIAGAAAQSVATADNTTFLFTFPRPAYGPVTIRWETNHGVVDLEVPANGFDPSRFGGQWNYNLIDPVPTVVLTSPTNGTTLLAPAETTLRATAIDRDGTISRVEFFANTIKLGESTNSPYTYIWSGIPAETYSLIAVATDNIGLVSTSLPVVLNIVTSLPINLIRGPYLQIGTPISGVVRWRTDLVSDGVVLYGTDPEALTGVATEASITNEHIVTINGLQPSTRYYYSVGSSGRRITSGTNFWFVTAPVPGTQQPVRIWVLGDAGTANNNQRAVRDAYHNWITTNGGPADIWLMLGDNAYNSGTDEEHQGAVFEMYPDTLRNHFLWPTIGNHETSQSTSAEHFPYLDIFSLPQSGQAGGIASGTELYYSFDYANVHFVCLDSMTSGRSADSPMADWLKLDLETTEQDWIIVFFHHPPYTKGSHNSDSESDLVAIRQNIVPILESYGVDLVLGGHSHCYERSYLLDGHYGLSTTLTASMKVDAGDGRESGTGPYRKNSAGRGVVYSVAGSSGQATGGQLNHPAHFTSLNQLGSVILDVNTNRMDMIFLNSAGETPDRFTFLKEAQVVPLRIQSITLVAEQGSHILTFPATANVAYTIEHATELNAWEVLETISAVSTNRMIEMMRPNEEGSRYYRLRTP